MMSGRNLRLFRERYDMSQTRVAEILGVSVRTIQRQERAKKLPRKLELAVAYMELAKYSPDISQEVWSRVRNA